jgi:nucleoid-associated protein YgaU
VTRELKLALIVGFSLVLIVTVLISDHLSKARQLALVRPEADTPRLVPSIPADLAYAPVTPVLGSEPIAPPQVPSDSGARRAQGDPTPESAVPELPGFTPVNIGQGQRAAASDLSTSPKPAIQEPQPEPIIERIYVVKENDSLYQIAGKVYGNGGSWTKIAQLNSIKPEQLKVGMRLRIPNDAPHATLSAPAAARIAMNETAPRSKVQTYKVQPGDTLTGISRKLLGTPARTGDIRKINQLDDEDSLTVGDTLKIPLN